MKWYVLISIFQLLINSGYENKKPGMIQLPQKIVDSNIVLSGRFIDSFTYKCKKYADCICAEASRFIITKNHSDNRGNGDTIGVFIFCLPDGFTIEKDSSYRISVKAGEPKGTILFDPPQFHCLKLFWTNSIKYE